MVIEIDVLCPDRNDTPPEPKQALEEQQKRSIDRSRVTRLQIINIRGDIVDVEN